MDKFVKDVKYMKERLLFLLLGLKQTGNRIVGISASAKGNTMLNYCGIDGDILDYVTDISPLKVGKYTPGSHLKVEHDDKLIEDQPEYGLMLSCNFQENIVKAVRERGYMGKIIIPYPEFKVV